MIIWINGPFGVGKTQTAYELAYQVPGSFVFDPEEVGFFIAKHMPRERRKPDFQDYEAWRTTVSAMLRELQVDRDKPIIVPMTVVSPRYFREILDPLKASGIGVRNFTLTAAPETIRKRLTKRGDRGSWNYRQIDRCLEGLRDPIFADYIDTDAHNLYEVVDKICATVEYRNGNRGSGAARRFLRRMKVLARHVRI